MILNYNKTGRHANREHNVWRTFCIILPAWFNSWYYCFAGSEYGLKLILNIEQYEHMQGQDADAGVKVTSFIFIHETII